MKQPSRILPVLLALACAVPLFSALGRPALAFDDINPRSATFGRAVALDDLYAERGVALRFIASWCEVCRAELPELEELRTARALPIVLVAADEHGAPDSLLIVAERAGLAAPILYVPERQARALASRFAYETLPATYLIDRSGKIRLAHEGAFPVARLAREMESALGS